MENKNRNNNLIYDYIQKYNIVDVVQNYLQLIKKGNDYKAICPFHADSNPSLSISPSKNVFKCFTCNTAGNSIQFIMLYKKIPFSEAIKEFKSILNINDSNLDRYINSVSKVNEEELEIFNANKKAAFLYHNTLYEKENIRCLEYLKSRDINDEIIKFYEIGYAPKQPNTYLLDLFEMTKNSHNFDAYKLLKAGLVSLTDKNNFIDFFHDRLLIPIKNEYGYISGFSGRTINPNEKIKYINTKTTIVFQKENILFNYFAFDKTKYEEIYVVEGFMDVFALRKLGIENVVASMGTSFTINQINLIKKYKNIKRIILCFDNDNAGNNATISLVEKLIKNNFNVFLVRPYDKKFKDIDELTRSLKKEECLKLINDQVGFIEYQIEILKRINLSYKDKKIELINIIDMLNEFAYDEKFFTEDKKMISDFFDIDILEVESLVKNRKGNYNNYQNNNKTKNINLNNDVFNKYNNLINEELLNNQYNQINNVISSPLNNNGTFNSNVDMQLKKQEIDLVLNLIFSKQLSQLYLKYLGFLLFNNQDQQMISRVLKVIIETVRNFQNKDAYSSSEVFKTIVQSNKLDKNQKIFLHSLIKKHLKLNNLPNISKDSDFFIKQFTSLEEKLLSQGIEILLKIKMHHFSLIFLEKKMLLAKNKVKNNTDATKKIEKEIKKIEKDKNDFMNEINEVRLELVK